MRNRNLRKPMAGVLVLVELGAEWPFWVGNTSGKAGRRVLAQEEGETPEAFASRVAEHLGTMFTRRLPLELSVLACNERCDERAMSARNRLCQALLSGRGGSAPDRHAQGQGHETELLLTASGRTGRVRHALSALATDLAASWAADDSHVGVRFGDEMPRIERDERDAQHERHERHERHENVA